MSEVWLGQALNRRQHRTQNVNTHRLSAGAEVRQLCESVSDSNTKNLILLKAIEQTVGWLVWLQDRAKSDASFAESASSLLKRCERKKVIDEDGTLCALFEEVETGLADTHDLLMKKIDIARTAPELTGSDKSAIVKEYAAALAAVADLHNQMVELRWAVGEHDADLEQPTGQAFTNPEELKAFLATV